MNLPKETLVIVATILVSGLLFTSLVMVNTGGHEVTYGEQGPTPYSADHARAQATARDDAAAPTF